jgi:hypothetical protein
MGSDDFARDDRKALRRIGAITAFPSKWPATRFKIPSRSTHEERISMLAVMDDRLLFVAYTLRDERYPSSVPGEPILTCVADATTKTAKHNWK